MLINNFELFMKKARSGIPATGMVITLTDPAVSELAADSGLDFTWIDMEHSPMTVQDASNHIMALRGTSCAPLVRVPGNDPALIKVLIDLAPAGIILPMINSAEEMKKAVDACRYPPEGTRGCGMRRSIQYGAKPTSTYFEESRREPLIIAQIEHIDAVRNLDSILAVKHLGSICIGPYDLSGSMGKFASPDDPEVGKVIDEVCAKAHAAGVMAGAFAENYECWKHRKLNWAALSTDANAIFARSKQKQRELSQCVSMD